MCVLSLFFCFSFLLRGGRGSEEEGCTECIRHEKDGRECSERIYKVQEATRMFYGDGDKARDNLELQVWARG